MEQAVVKPELIPLWIEVVKTLGYVLGVGLPAYFGWKMVKARMGGKDGNSN